jgi:hypothetical protein
MAPRERKPNGRIDQSRKPEIFADMITAYFPTCPKLGMFYRALDDPEAECQRRAKREAAGGISTATKPRSSEPPSPPRPPSLIGEDRDHPPPFLSELGMQFVDAALGAIGPGIRDHQSFAQRSDGA